MNKNITLSFILLLFVFTFLPFGKSGATHPEAHSDSITKDNLTQYYQYSAGLLQQRITLSVRDAKLKDVLDRISAMTGANFIYGESLTDNEEIDLEVKEEPMEDVLKLIFDGADVGFTVVNRNHVVIARQKSLEKKLGKVIGKVTDEENKPLCGANVMVKETKYGCATCPMGKFTIKNLDPGVYTVRVSFIGYKPKEQEVEVYAGKTTEINFKLEPESFKIGGIQVTGTNDLIPDEPNTKTVIESGEIEHYQATNLGDVLNLVPGIQKSDNPGLNKTGQVAVRGTESDPLSAFGTLIIVDGVPVSNNANLQFEALQGSKFGSNTIGKGIDLRTIPADNLESIEVMSGLPSVKYGDFTSGIINIKTKMGAQPHRFKFKNNPHTSEGNLGGGFALAENKSLSYNFNLARSERDIRLTGDEYTRYTGQLVYSTMSWNNRLSSNYKLRGQVIHDEEQPRDDFSKTNNYNRGFTVGANTWGTFQQTDAVSSIDYNAYLTMERIRSRKSKLVQSDLRVLPNGDTVAAYMGVVKNEGMEWTGGGRLEWNNVFFTGKYIHKVLIGGEYKYEDNTGEGIIVDSLYNYYGPDSPLRSRSFDEIPAQSTLSLYAEDKLTGRLGIDFSLLYGFRYEMYHPQELNLSGLWGDGNVVNSRQGTFFNPRIALMLFFSDNYQMRLSAGKTSKSPPMSRIYPNMEVFQWRNPYDSTNHTFTYDRTVENLQGYQETQFEISQDYKIRDFAGITVSGYYKERSNQPVGQPVPIFYEYNDGNSTFINYIGEYSLEQNIGRYYSKGLEFTFRSARIKSLNMNFSVTGSYNFVKNPGSGISYDDDPDETLGQFPNYHVPGVSVDTLMGWTYNSSGRWDDEIQLNYYLKYTHPVLGLWVTLRAEQIVKERYQSINLVPINYAYVTDPGTLDDVKLSRDFQESIKVKPPKWLFSINVSKSLFEGAEVSFYVNNFLDDPAIRRYYINPDTESDEKRNPDLFYGIEFSVIADKFFKGF